MKDNLLRGMTTIRRFILAGRAILTIKNPATGVRFTYKINKKVIKDGKRIYFVSCLIGPNYKYIGTIFTTAYFSWTKKSKVNRNDKVFKAFYWFWTKLQTETDLQDVIMVYHHGRCGRCGRILTVPASIIRGIGPICKKKCGYL